MPKEKPKVCAKGKQVKPSKDKYEELKVSDSESDISLMSPKNNDSDRSGDLYMVEVSEARLKGEHYVAYYEGVSGTRLVSFKRTTA